MICQKCKDNFEEKDIQESHDIPKYMGGTDYDGRHQLCKKCHKKYELQVLIKCLKVLGIEIDFEKEPKNYMSFIKNLDNNSKQLCKDIAKKEREIFFNG